MINLLLCGNKKVFDGALTELISITNRTKESINCYIFTMDASRIKPEYVPIENKQIDFLNKVIQKKNKENKVTKVDVTNLYEQEFLNCKNESAYCTPYTLLRLLADMVPNIPDKLLYLDIDMMIGDDLSKLYNIDVSEYEYAAVKEKYGSIFIRPDYINAGMLLMNMKKIKETKLLEKARNYETEKQVYVKKTTKPLFHVTAPTGWINDPNGFSVYDGKIHLFYQYNPYQREWGPMHWGHSVTDDMVRWEQLPAAIAPDQEYDKAGCFSGSAIEADGKHVLVYTGVTRVKQADGSEQERQNQCIAFGDGKDYVKYEKNPVVTGEMLPEGCSRIDFRDPKIWKENDTYYLIVGNKNDNQVGQVVLCSSKNLTDWKFETILASNENGDIGTMWECPDFFALKDKHVLICSPQDMKARKYEFHNGHNSVYFLGDYDANRCRFSKEQPHTLDYGMDFYAPQTTELPDGRRIMIAWMKSWDACVIPNSQDWQGMMTFPRELEIKENRIWQNPVKELENYYQNPCCYEHTEIEGETVLAGVEGRTIDLTVTLEDGENTIFSIKLAADSEYETSYTYNKETRLLEIDRTYCGVTKDVVCVRKFRIEDPAGLKKMRFILDYHSIELFINDGQQTATTAICTPLNAKDIYFFSDKKMTMSVEKHDIIM